MINVTGGVTSWTQSVATKASAQPVRGHIRQRGNSFQVVVRAGTDPITGRELRRTESTTDEREAQAILKKLVRQVEDQRHARTRATFGTALEKWLQVHDIEASTLESYRIYARLDILPALGHVPIGDVKTQGLDEFYADLRRCKARCRGQSGLIDHRTDGPHECRVVKHRRPPGRPPVNGYPEHDLPRGWLQGHSVRSTCLQALGGRDDPPDPLRDQRDDGKGDQVGLDRGQPRG